jgi:hypothetical protein
MQKKEKICEKLVGAFVICLEGNIYCKLALSGRNIRCKYLANYYDHNDLRPCLNPKYKSLTAVH